ncbi:MAG TPA: MFS transporter [Marinobacter sp.]|nr:MFS transporter [Marinobacter sp.]
MIATIRSVCSLLIGMGILLAGSGFLGTLLGLRASVENFSEFTIGLIMSAFFAGYIVGSYLCPHLIRRVGHIRTFAALSASAAVVSLLHGLMIDPWVWGLLRLINGICMLGLYMVVESWLSGQVTHRRGLLFAVYMMVSLAALGAGQFLIAIYGPEELASFVLVGLLFCLGLIPLALTRQHQPVLPAVANLPLRQLFAISHVGAVGSFASGMITGGFWGMSAVYALSVGMGNADVALFVAAAIFGGALLQWPVGHLSDRFDRRLVLLWVALAAALMAGLIFWLGNYSRWMLVIFTALYGGLSFSLYALSVAQTHDQITAENTMGATRGLLLLNGIGATLGPLLVGAAMAITRASFFPALLALLLLLLGYYVRRQVARDPAVPADLRSEFVPLMRTSEAAMEMDPRTDVDMELDLSGKLPDDKDLVATETAKTSD